MCAMVCREFADVIRHEPKLWAHEQVNLHYSEQAELPFDCPGVIRYIGTLGFSRPFENPCTSGEMSVIASHSVRSKGGAEAYLLALDLEDPAHTRRRGRAFWAGSQPASWIAVDLGVGRLLYPTAYCLRSNDLNRCQLRNWRLEASSDVGAEEWVTLSEHRDCHLLDGRSAERVWGVDAPGIEGAVGWRYFRVLQTGHDSSGKYYLSCTGIELFGTLTLNHEAIQAERVGGWLCYDLVV